MAAGDAIEASLTLLTVILGLAALTRPLPFSGRVRACAVWSVVAGGLVTLAVTGRIERWQGALLLAAYLGRGAAVVAGAAATDDRRTR